MTGSGQGGGPGGNPATQAHGQKPLPGQSVCKFCQTPLTPHQAVKGGVCNAPRCEMRQVQEASRAVFQRDWDSYVGRQRRAVEAAAPDIGRAAARLDRDPGKVAIGVVPHQDRPIVALPQMRRDEFAAHMDEIIDKAFAEGQPSLDLDEREFEERNEEPLIDATCATCQGKCCILGGPSYGFLTAVNIQQYRARHPGVTGEEIKAHYLSKLPERSVEHSCVYHGPVGCVLDRKERGDVCNRYHCNPQTQLLKALREMKAEAAIIIANEDNAGPRVATFEADGGWKPLSGGAEMAEFAEDLDPDPELMQRAVNAAMEQIPPNHPARGSSVGPSAPTCQWCGQDIDRHKAATTKCCGRADCEAKRIEEASLTVTRQKHERYMARLERVKTAYAEEVGEAAKALQIDPETMLVGVVPHQNVPVIPLPAERRAAFEAHLDKIAAEGFALIPEEYHNPRNRASVDGPESALADACCATCQGSCCKLGGPSNAFLDKWAVAMFRIDHPAPTPEAFKAQYLDLLPDASVRDACVYQTDRGCNVPREKRATICNSFHCKGLNVVFEAAKAQKPAHVAIIAHDDGDPRALGLFNEEEGWRPFIRDGEGRVG